MFINNKLILLYTKQIKIKFKCKKMKENLENDKIWPIGLKKIVRNKDSI